MNDLEKSSKLNKFIEFMDISKVSAYEVSKTTKITEAAIGRILNKKGTNPHSKTVDALYNFSINYQKKTISFLEKMTGVGLAKGLATLAAGAAIAPISVTGMGVIGLTGIGAVLASSFGSKDNTSGSESGNNDLNEEIENLSELLIQTNNLIDRLKLIESPDLKDLIKLKETYAFKNKIEKDIKDLVS